MALQQPPDQKRMDAPPPANTVASSGARGLFGLRLWVHAWAWGGILAVVLLLLGAPHSYDGRNVWRDWTEAKELRRPAYAYSSLETFAPFARLLVHTACPFKCRCGPVSD